MGKPEEESKEAARPTLIRPPPEDPSKAAIENSLEVTELAVIAPVSLDTNTTYLTLPTNTMTRTSSPMPANHGIPPAPAVSTAAP